jgi:hypothetical protein
MPPVIPQHLLDAKKRMKMGLHPAVLAAVQRSVEQAKRQLQQSAPQPALRPRGNTGVVDLGIGVNPGHARAVPPGGDTRAAMDPLANQRYHAFLQGNADTGGVREVHVYGTGANRQVRSFARKVTPQLQEQIGSTLRQQLSNSATAEDKMLALAHRAAAGQLAQRVGSKRRFSRNPGPMQRY